MYLRNLYPPEKIGHKRTTALKVQILVIKMYLKLARLWYMCTPIP